MLRGAGFDKGVWVVALVLSILSFFWRMYPAIARLDKDHQITPSGYSRTLGIMIAGFVGGLAAALVVSVAVGPGA